MSRVRHSTSQIRAARREAKHKRAKEPRGERTVEVVRARAARPAREKRERPLLFGPRRIAAVAAVFALGGLLLLYRAFELQILERERYQEIAQRQATGVANIRAKRGVIKDRHDSELAITVDVDTVMANPRQVEDPAQAAQRLAPLLSMRPKALLEKLKSERAFVFLKRRVDRETAEQVRALGLKGVGIQPEPKRFYSNRELASHVLGFSDAEGAGKAGVELHFDLSLRGRSYELSGLRDALGRHVYSEGIVPHAELEGSDLVLTLDRQVQHDAEQALAAQVQQSRAQAGVALVLEVATGDVLALASYPTYNPNNLKEVSPNQQLNRAVSAAYEPGSTLKIVTIAGALEEGIIRAESKVDCEGGKLRIGRRTIGDSHAGYGELSIAEIMKVSSNVCSAKIGMSLGRERLAKWLAAFGLGTATGVELPGELKGLVRPPETWRDITLANVAFGQGLTATPLQIAQAALVIASGGLLVRPRLVRGLVDKDGRVHAPTRPPAERVLSERTARSVGAMLEEVTKKGGTAEAAAIPGFRVAGKTGTAQKIDPVTRAYSHELYVSSFVGYAPAERPEVLILVMIDEPRGQVYGGQVAAPAFQRIAVSALASREIFPEDGPARDAFVAAYRPVEQGSAPPPAGAELEEDEGLEVKPAETKEKGEGAALAAVDGALSLEAQALLGIERAPEPSDRAGAAARGARGARGLKMPNFGGLLAHEVLDRSAEVPCDPVLVGTGRVISQTPAAGDPLAPGARCELVLSPKS